MATTKLTAPMQTVLTKTLRHAMRTPEGETVYVVDVYGVVRTVSALQRRGLVVMETRTVLDGNGRAHQATTSWLTAEGVKVAQRLAGVEPVAEEQQQAAQEPQERPGSAPVSVEPQERPEDGRDAVLARLDAVWSAGYVTSPPMSWEERRVAAEVVADYYTAGGTELLHGRMDRDAVVAEYRARDPYDLMSAYGSVRLRTGGDVWALVARNRSGERPESLVPVVAKHVDAGAPIYRRTVVVVRDGVESDGASDTVMTSRVAAYLAEELGGGGTVHRHASGVLRLVRGNGARLELRPVRAEGAAQGVRLVERVEKERQEFTPSSAGERACVRRTVLHTYSDGTRVRFVLDAYSDGERLARVTRFAADHVQGESLPMRRRLSWWARGAGA
jgi:hypothetical protein